MHRSCVPTGRRITPTAPIPPIVSIVPIPPITPITLITLIAPITPITNSQQHKKRVPRQVSYLSEDSPMGKAVTYSPDFTQYHRRYWA